MQKSKLIVEGPSDAYLFEKLCSKHEFDVKVTVDTPSFFGGKDTKQGVLNILQIAIKQLQSSYIEKLGIIIDSDYAKDGGGIENTLLQIHKKIKDYGYSTHYKKFSNSGIYFEGENGLPNLGVWVMPNNLDEGMLEDWMLSICHPNEQKFLNNVTQIVTTMPSPRFSKIHEAKAIANTWLAWQKKPDRGLYNLFQEGLIDENHQNYKNWLDWMTEIFKK
ncbi:hypothetical protein C5B41_03750 [Acinetobacter ursingii]|uniref:DUF3226 domain-containing protein n=1 Tax=Acinetobacter ursingii TaxID=108980 RepID=UPI000CF2A616|nr:DUF3226 domain-containing protein [Acinetobacter ursingii]PPZ95505.1 hypothetical protein C5B41_03750 [Acinetobacter ursingii]